MNSDIIREIDFSRRFRGLKPWGALDYFRPCWAYKNSLFVWCDEHLRWNEHGLSPEEAIEGTITSRCPHHSVNTRNAGTNLSVNYGPKCDGADFYCMGEAPVEVVKIIRRYPGRKATHTPPPIRRVYPNS